jgi:hypothetical protein
LCGCFGFSFCATIAYRSRPFASQRVDFIRSLAASIALLPFEQFVQVSFCGYTRYLGILPSRRDPTKISSARDLASSNVV